MNKIKLYLFAFMAFAVLALAVTNYFNTKKVEKYKSDNIELRVQNEILTDQNRLQAKQIKELTDDIDRLNKKLKRR